MAGLEIFFGKEIYLDSNLKYEIKYPPNVLTEKTKTLNVFIQMESSQY